MLTGDLKQRVEELGLRESSYHIGSFPPNDVYVIEESDGLWYFYYNERGMRVEETPCATEESACEYLLERLSGDPSCKK